MMEATPARDGNLGDLGQSQRLRKGVLVFGATMLAAVVALELHMAPALLLVLAPAFFFAANFVFMGLFRT